MSTPDTPKLMTVREVALRLAVSPDTVYVWSSNGTLDKAKIKLGKRLRFNSEMIEQIIKEGFSTNKDDATSSRAQKRPTRWLISIEGGPQVAVEEAEVDANDPRQISEHIAQYVCAYYRCPRGTPVLPLVLRPDQLAVLQSLGAGVVVGEAQRYSGEACLLTVDKDGYYERVVVRDHELCGKVNGVVLITPRRAA